MQLNKILMIDDDDSIRRITELTLSAIGKFEVMTASSGKDGLQKVIEFCPDLILLDVMMPGMDGPTVLVQLKDNPITASIPVVFMTAKVQKHEFEMYNKMGANGVISKPFETVELPNTLRSIYARAMASMPIPLPPVCAEV